ncbi:metal-dependent hydrolase [uncultured Massilia sp.]|uniref:metal-dependent hydrolase n=1 Tax=uncultured Massilia sp. TaxID=169973 RepID=UPI0025FC252D|nr:metal-dependent hydrolase [uncultured Massilia sp.]
MDNLTHSVVGLGIGALIDRSLAPEPDTAAERLRARLLLTVCCLASNFPDLDLVLTRLLEAPLGYLLHHRGHTHTLLVAVGEAALLLGLVWLLWPGARRLLRASAPARRGAVLAAGAGLLLHIGMDGLNVYGVHPFWPFDAGWYYGDLVFIVEPVFWIAFGVPLAAMVRRPWLRRAWLALLVAVPAGFTLAGFLPWGSLAGLLLLGAVLAWLQRRGAAPSADATAPTTATATTTQRPRRRRTALAAGLAASLAFVAVQAAAMHAARGMIAAEIARLDGGERLLDVALSAYPANPLCWSFVTVARNAGDDAARSAGDDAARGAVHGAAGYHLRRGLLAIAPGVAPVGACPAPIAGAAPSGATALAWTADERLDLAVLRTLGAHDCHVNAWLRFARAPWLANGVATDVRWSPPGTPNFSTIDYAALAQAPCPHPVPGWGMPRADLLAAP